MSLSVGITEALVGEFEARDVPWIYRARPLYVGRVDGADVGIIWASPAPLWLLWLWSTLEPAELDTLLG